MSDNDMQDGSGDEKCTVRAVCPIGIKVEIAVSSMGHKAGRRRREKRTELAESTRVIPEHRCGYSELRRLNPWLLRVQLKLLKLQLEHELALARLALAYKSLASRMGALEAEVPSPNATEGSSEQPAKGDRA
jgi:hypothetical protein